MDHAAQGYFVFAVEIEGYHPEKERQKKGRKSREVTPWNNITKAHNYFYYQTTGKCALY